MKKPIIKFKSLLCAVMVSPFLIANGVMANDINNSDIKTDYHKTENFAELALKCVHSEYPNKLAHSLNSDADVKPPRELYPAFYGCFDWHSSVHGHWLLAKLVGTYPDAPYVSRAKAALKQSITKENIAIELGYITAPGRASFERPYGLAWLMQLHKELLTSTDPELRALAPILEPLANASAIKIKSWLPKLNYPIRIGEHSQTAFGLGLIYDWAIATNDTEFVNLITERGKHYYLNDKNCPLSYEPDGEAFLSPCIGEASFMARILPQDEYAKWLAGFLPQIPKDGKTNWLTPAIVTDRSDPKLAHLDGVNLSRAWMLNTIAHHLPPKDHRIKSLLATAKTHSDAAIPNVTGEHYEGGHWLGTFAVYLITEEGVKR